MKSHFTKFNSETDCPHARSPILARSTKEVAPISAARRFELRYNASPHFARRRQERRQGQALLLAVLIMLLAALLSAGFLAVLSGNLNQTARIADKTRAIEASRTGVAYANAQLSTSSKGDLWRPIDVSPALTPNDPGYNFYYSQLDKVQGWANTMTPPNNPTLATFERDKYFFRNDVYGKFPAPNQALGDAPKFLLKVEDLPVDPDADFYNPTLNPGHPYDAQHAGEIKITSIGLSDDDPNVFHKTIAYKTGRRKSPWASALRSISNWDFKARNNQGGVPYSAVADPVLNQTPMANLPVPIKDATAFSNDDVPFNVVIVKKSAPANSRGAVVTQVTPPANNAPAGTRTILTLARVDGPIGTDEVIQKAAAIGTGSSIDLLNVGTLPTGAPATLLDFPLQNQPNGILANGSVWLQNQIQLSNLRKYGTKLFASGSFAIDNAVTATQKATVLENSGDIGPTNTLDPNSNRIVPSSQPSFPGDIVLTAAAASNGVDKTDLIRDGWNKIGTQTLGLDYSNSRDVEPFKPAKIDSAENLARYRALTRNSGVDSNGNRLGVYIDNRDDVEKVGTAPMTQSQLVNMLTSPPTTTPLDYQRMGVAATQAQGALANTVSLEQRHLRGWVGADEFLARGVLVELVQLPGDNPFIRVTYDARSDANPDGPDNTKTIRDSSGNPQDGVYTRNLPWPANGTLFAEGNVRIRGSVNLSTLTAGANPVNFPSLTVVSMNNIYVEGSLTVDNSTIVVNGNTVPAPNRKKLMLLAKKNVIVNPTRAVLARTDAQTLSNNGVTPLSVMGTPMIPVDVSIPVRNALSFRRGDYVSIQATPKAIRGIVTADVVNDTQLSVRTADSGTIMQNAIVRSPLEGRQVDDPANVRAVFSLVDTTNAINRRIMVPVAQITVGNIANRNNKLVFDHVADLKQQASTTIGLNIKAEDFSATGPRPADFVAELTNKQPLDATQNNDTKANSITDTNKILRTYNNFPALANPTNQKDFAPTANKTLTQFASEISTTSESNNLPDPDTKGYKYTATIDAATGGLPSYALTGIGLRYAPGATVFTAPQTPSTPDNNARQDFNKSTRLPNGFTIPLATSVEFDLNGALANFGTIGEMNTVQYVGFNPVFGTSDDGLTIDRNFYQLKADTALKSTMDVRTLTLPTINAPTNLTSFPNSIVMRRSNAYSDETTSNILPDYRVKAIKVESYDSTNDDIKPAGGPMSIDAYVYAQEGSWFVIPGDYFRSNAPVRAEIDNTGKFKGSYIDYNNNNKPDTDEYIVDGTMRKVADLNRNGVVDTGEFEAALHLVRYNTVKIEFFGAIVENQTAVVADVVSPIAGQPPVIKGAVQDWTDKWASYNDSPNANAAPNVPFPSPPGSDPGNTGAKNNFNFISYAFDPSVAVGSPGANELRVPVTDDLIYEQ